MVPIPAEWYFLEDEKAFGSRSGQISNPSHSERDFLFSLGREGGLPPVDRIIVDTEQIS
jgi:hypothetical protein